jgi:predicted ABC-type ATPase
MNKTNTKQARLRMFAGPNGSGKSTLKSVIADDLLGVYINPDEIEKEIQQFDFLDLKNYEVITTEKEVLAFFASSTLLKKADLLEEANCLKFTDNKLDFFEVSVNAYFASVCADFIRRKLLENRLSFTFETVMSAPDKIELLKTAQQAGYRTYLYYIATDDPQINIARVKQRVAAGGHNVPHDKIISRYERSLKQLLQAIKASNRAYIFDNSGSASLWCCEITDGKQIDYKQDAVPDWVYRYVVEGME